MRYDPIYGSLGVKQLTYMRSSQFVFRRCEVVWCLLLVPSLVNNRRASTTRFSRWQRLIDTEMRHAVEMTAHTAT